MGNSWDNKATSPAFTDSITTPSSTFNLLNTTVTTLNAFGAASTLNLANSVTGAQTINLATGTTSTGNSKTINIGTGGASGSTTNVYLGSSAGTSLTTVNGSLLVGVQGLGYTPTAYATAGLNFTWNKGGDGTGASYIQNFRQAGVGGFNFELYDVDCSLITNALAIDGSGNAVFSGRLLSSKATGGIGYNSSARGSVTQTTSKNTNVTCNTMSGRITMHNAALSGGAEISFYVFNSNVTYNDVVIVTANDGFNGNYLAQAYLISNGAFAIRVTNTTGTSYSEAANINFAVIKAG